MECSIFNIKFTSNWMVQNRAFSKEDLGRPLMKTKSRLVVEGEGQQNYSVDLSSAFLGCYRKQTWMKMSKGHLGLQTTMQWPHVLRGSHKRPCFPHACGLVLCHSHHAGGKALLLFLWRKLWNFMVFLCHDRLLNTQWKPLVLPSEHENWRLRLETKNI